MLFILLLLLLFYFYFLQYEGFIRSSQTFTNILCVLVTAPSPRFLQLRCSPLLYSCSSVGSSTGKSRAVSFLPAFDICVFLSSGNQRRPFSVSPSALPRFFFPNVSYNLNNTAFLWTSNAPP